MSLSCQRFFDNVRITGPRDCRMQHSALVGVYLNRDHSFVALCWHVQRSWSTERWQARPAIAFTLSQQRAYISDLAAIELSLGFIDRRGVQACRL